MKTAKLVGVFLLLTSFVTLAFAPVSRNPPGAEGKDFLKGKVHFLDVGTFPLSERLSRAAQEFMNEKDGNLYFAGYSFPSKHSVNMKQCGRVGEDYCIQTRGDKIKISRKRDGVRYLETGLDDESGESAGLLFLFRAAGGRTEMADISLLDLDSTYESSAHPLYWLGEVKTEESFRFLEKEFQSQGSDLQSEMVFAISLHSSPRASDFLQAVALGSFDMEVRKDAVFWLGNDRNSASLGRLREIIGKSRDREVREQVVYSLHLQGSKESVEELIKIARRDGDKEVRKNAIFWLGQMASQESAKILRAIVEEKDEDVDLREEAVFAISQLPREQAVPILIEIARSNKSLSVREQAIFWLGQVGGEKALEFFEEILLKQKMS